MSTATTSPGAEGTPRYEVQLATATDAGTERQNNEDFCGTFVESDVRTLVAVADGVSGEEGGEIASRTAIEVTVRTYAESSVAWDVPKRLYRAVQQANIDIYDRALVVTELRRMATTLTALVVEGPMAHVAHVGDSRLYLIRDRTIVQKTKDHTVAADRRRIGVISAERAKQHPGRSVLTRSLGRELIAAVDRIAFPVASGDSLLICSDGLYNVLADEEILEIASDKDPTAACADLLETANARGTPDNLTAAVVRVMGTVGDPPPGGLRGLVSRLLGL
jgi:serine/threonine protein phosphatase PrpC